MLQDPQSKEWLGGTNALTPEETQRRLRDIFGLPGGQPREAAKACAAATKTTDEPA